MQRAWMVRLTVISILTLTLSVFPAWAATELEPGPGPSSGPAADRLTSALVAMGQAQVGDDVVKAWLGQQEEIPRLAGEQLARLKTAGLSDEVLLHLVQGAEVVARASDVAPVPPPENTPVDSGAGSRIRVIVQSVPAVDYCELALDGRVIATLGRLFEGAVPAGSYAPRSKVLPLRKPTVLFEGEVAPGRHVVQTGFVISRLQEEFGHLREGRRQRVLAEGVRALDSEEEAAADGGTVCSVGPGEVCLVTARFRKVDPGLPGGRIGYAISYDTLVLTERAEPEEVQAASWAAGD